MIILKRFKTNHVSWSSEKMVLLKLNALPTLLPAVPLAQVMPNFGLLKKSTIMSFCFRANREGYVWQVPELVMLWLQRPAALQIPLRDLMQLKERCCCIPGFYYHLNPTQDNAFRAVVQLQHLQICKLATLLKLSSKLNRLMSPKFSKIFWKMMMTSDHKLIYKCVH